MSKTIHELAIQGKDQTGSAFASVGAKAKKLGSLMSSALAGAGAFLGMRAIVSNVKEMGKLSDQAMKTGLSVEDLTRATTAFQVAGLDICVDQLTKAMQYLNKNTGKQGMSALFETIEGIASIQDPAKRGEEMVKMFGRSGMELQPLINGGAETVQKFRDLMSIMPGVSTAAANVGDEFADALTIMHSGTKSILQGALGKLLSYFSEGLPGGVRAGALNAMNWLETFFKKCHAWIAKVGTEILSFGALVGDVFTMGPKEAWKLYLATNEAADDEFEKRIEAANKSRADYVEKLSKFNVDDLANAFGKQSGAKAAEKKAKEASEATITSKAIRNDLILAGSNEAAKLAAFGPQYQSESKKQTAILEKIDKNTDATATAVENNKNDLEVVNG